MITTLDITDEEAACMRRALTAHIITLTEELRAQDDEHSAAGVERMCADIRTAAALAGRLPFSRFARSTYDRNSTPSQDDHRGGRVEHRVPASTDSDDSTGDGGGDD